MFAWYMLRWKKIVEWEDKKEVPQLYNVQVTKKLSSNKFFEYILENFTIRKKEKKIFALVIMALNLEIQITI